MLAKKLPKGLSAAACDLRGHHGRRERARANGRQEARKCQATRKKIVTQLEHKKQILRRARRVVVKIGSQILSSAKASKSRGCAALVRELAELHDQKKEIVVVSSGAVAAGMTRLGRKERPQNHS